MSHLEDITPRMDDLDRRSFLSVAARRLLAVGLAPYALSPSVFAEEPTVQAGGGKAKSVIYLYMNGGMSHIDTFDPKPGTKWGGATKTIPTVVDGLQIAEPFARLAKHMDKVALIRSMNTSTGAHYPGYYYMHTGYKERGTIRHPEIGSWILRLDGKHNQNLPGHVQIAGGSRQVDQGFLPTSYAPLRDDSPADGLQHCSRPKGVSENRFDHRLDLLARADAAFEERYDVRNVKAYGDCYDEAVRLMTSEDLAAFDLTQESQQTRQAYGEDKFGQGCLLARRLVEHGVRFAEVSLGSWDTHNDMYDRIADRGAILDQGLSALLDDLHQRGLLDSTLVVLATEFGRKPDIDEAQTGRGHWPKAFSCMLAGGGIRGGVVHGSTDERGGEVADKLVSVGDFHATIGHAVGLDLDKRIYSPNGRPFTFGDKGRPVLELFA